MSNLAKIEGLLFISGDEELRSLILAILPAL